MINLFLWWWYVVMLITDSLSILWNLFIDDLFFRLFFLLRWELKFLFVCVLLKVRLVDAGFVWTEPHSKRLKVKLTIQKEVMNGAILQQVFVVDYVVQSQMCGDCHRVEAKDFWKAVIQVRQKVMREDDEWVLHLIFPLC